MAASGSPGSTRMAMKMSSVTPKSVGMAMSNRWPRYLRMVRRRRGRPRRASRLVRGRTLPVQPERVHATQLREDPRLAVVAFDGGPPHGQVVGEPDQVERRRLIQQRHALGEELLALA